MKYLSLLVVSLALFGAGCWAKPQTPVVPANQPATTTQDQQLANAWLAYQNTQEGFSFNYPANAKNVTAATNETYNDKVIVSFDLGQTVNDPEAKSVPETRLDVLKVKGDLKTQEGQPMINDGFYYEFGWNPQVDIKVGRKTIGRYELGRSTYTDAGAGNLYTTYAYTYPLGNNEFILFRFVIHSVNCANYEGTGFKCLAFDEARDIKVPEQIMTTLKLNQAAKVPYTFTDGNITAKTKYYEIKVSYPVMTGGEAAVAKVANDKIEGFIDAEVAQFKKDAQAAVDYPGPGPWYLNYYYNIPYSKNGLISIVLQKEEFLGGAHPNTTYKTFLFNTNSSKFLALSDLFKPTSDYLGAIATYSKT
ncbi:MAG: DUF4163 domain-containing protein, partial [Patescibacteria group bacterium]|nr:DUF4163 domain-containing protein [Patescibacteria group bacterium]